MNMFRRQKALILSTIFLSGIVLFFQNCSDIKINGGHSTQASSTNSPEPPDLMSYGSIPPNQCNPTDPFGASLELWPLNPPKTIQWIDGKNYEVRVFGDFACGSNPGYFDLGLRQRDITDFRFGRPRGMVAAIRITIPSSNLYISDLSYRGVMSTTAVNAPDAYYSISRVAGDIDLNKPNSDSYCNIYPDRVPIGFSYGQPTNPPKCLLKPGVVYYFNILDLTTAPPAGDYPVSLRLTYSLADCAKQNYLNAYVCPQ